MEQTDTAVIPGRPSRASSAAIIGLLIVALALSGYSWFLAAEARKPIGEGALFFAEISAAVDGFDATADPDLELRSIRNDLEVEAVSVVDRTRRIVESTSPQLVGTSIRGSVLADALAAVSYDNGITDGRFTAVATALGNPIAIDGVPTWEPDDVLYHAAHPIDDDSALIVSYDLSELLARRSAGRGIPQRALDLFGVAALLGIAAFVLMVLRSRSIRTYEVFAAESRLLREQADTLRIHNAELDVARDRAERALELAEEKNRIRAEFVLMINHELRTPLTGVVSGVGVVKELVQDEAVVALLDDVAANGRRLEEMLSQMLAVARVENRGLFVEPAPVTLGDVFDGVDTSMDRATIQYGPGVAASDRLMSDATTLPRLIDSLVGNAHQHGAGRVLVRCVSELGFKPMLEVGERPDDAVYILIADDGPGIDADFLPRAFQKFEKRSFSSGTGLGLYMSKMMVEALGGSISVITGSKGTVMAIAIPRAVEPSLVAS